MIYKCIKLANPSAIYAARLNGPLQMFLATKFGDFRELLSHSLIIFLIT